MIAALIASEPSGSCTPAPLFGREQPIDDQEAGQHEPDGQDYLHVAGTPGRRAEFRNENPEEPGRGPTKLANDFGRADRPCILGACLPQ
jgi:hypothetical protein